MNDRDIETKRETGRQKKMRAREWERETKRDRGR